MTARSSSTTSCWQETVNALFILIVVAGAITVAVMVMYFGGPWGGAAVAVGALGLLGWTAGRASEDEDS